MKRRDFERACQLAEFAGGGVGVTLTAEELRWLLNLNAQLLAACINAYNWIHNENPEPLRLVSEIEAAIHVAEDADHA